MQKAMATLTKTSGTQTWTQEELVSVLHKLQLASSYQITVQGITFYRTDPGHLLVAQTADHPCNTTLDTMYSYSHDDQKPFQLRLTLVTASSWSGITSVA